MSTIRFILNRGKFFNANNRGKAGLNWGVNNSVPIAIRECKDAICIPQSLLGVALKKDTIEVQVYKTPEKKQEDCDGTFRISTKRIKDWILINGLCIFSSGKQAIAIPVVMWERVDLPAMKDTKQMSLGLNVTL